MNIDTPEERRRFIKDLAIQFVEKKANIAELLALFMSGAILSVSFLPDEEGKILLDSLFSEEHRKNCEESWRQARETIKKSGVMIKFGEGK